MQLFYRELGQGRDVVILHGVFGNSDNWVTPGKLLAENYKLYLIDQRNHGQSPHSEEFNYDVLAEDIKEFILSKNLKQPDIIGHSMGGKVAMNFSSKYPELLRKLIVVDISPRYYKPHHQQILEGLNAIHLELLKSRQDAEEILKKYVEDFPTRQFLLKNLFRKDDNSFSWRINLKVLTEKITEVGQPLEANQKLDTETLFIRGGNSGYIAGKDEALIDELFNNYRIKTIEGAGHWVQAEKPAEFASVVKEFLG